MTVEYVIKKAILPLLFMAFWFQMVLIIMNVSGNEDLFWKIFLMGLPFGIHKVRVIIVPKMDIGGMVGTAAFSVIVGAFAGSVMVPVYTIRAIYILTRYLVTRITGRQ